MFADRFILARSTSFALALGLFAGTTALSQAPQRPTGKPAASKAAATKPAAPARQAPASAPPAKTETDGQVLKSGAVLPGPTEVEPDYSHVPKPNEPLEPYLLSKDVGPFMVMAHVFRGEHATKLAHALAIELRREHGLPAYVYFLKFQPGGSNIRDIPPTADRPIQRPNMTPPERDRIYDEAAVLVGNSKSIDDSEDVLKRVKKIKPRVLENSQSIWSWRNGKGLSRAMLTTNPLSAGQDILPGRPTGIGAVVDPSKIQFRPKVDELVQRMNKGPHSVLKCPAPYSLVVAEFGGRSTIDPDDKDFKQASFLKDSPLMTAHDDAEELAEKLAKDPQLKSLGVKPYVYHDRTTSRVLLGAFNTPDDPGANRVRQAALKFNYQVKDREHGTILRHLAPAPQLFPVPKS